MLVLGIPVTLFGVESESALSRYSQYVSSAKSSRQYLGILYPTLR